MQLTRRRALHLSGAAVGSPIALFMMPTMGLAQESTPSNNSATRPRFSKHLANYSMNDFASTIGKLHQRTVQPTDLFATASRADLLARHIESTGLDEHIKRYFSTVSPNTAPATNSNDTASSNALTRMRIYDPSIPDDILSSLPSGDPAATVKFMATNGFSGFLRSSASFLASAGAEFAQQQGQANGSVSPVAFEYQQMWNAKHIRHGESNVGPAVFERGDGLWRGGSHLQRVCYVKPSGEIHFNLCKAATGLSGLGVNTIKAWLKANPEALEELAEFMAVAPEAVLIMGTILIAVFILIAATC